MPSSKVLSLWISLRAALLSTEVLLLGTVTATALLIAFSPFRPRVAIPILGTPAWASWFDIYLVFPVLTFGLILALVDIDWRESFLLGSLAVLPMVIQVFDSYYWDFAAIAFSVQTWYGMLVAGICVSALLSCALYLAPKLRWDRIFHGRKTNHLLWVGAGASLSLALTEILLRPLTTVGIPLDSVGDIGIANAWGGYDLAHGINPFVVGLPPWGGPVSPPYGPVSVVLAAPFSVLPVDAAAHALSIAFALVSSYLLYLIVKEFNPAIASSAALFFLALPLTSWAMVAAVSPHFMVTAFILGALYFHIKGYTALSGATLALSVLTLYFPLLLLIPFLLYGGKTIYRFLAGFAPIFLTGAYLSLVVAQQATVATGVGSVAGGGLRFISYTLILQQTVGIEVFIAILALATLLPWVRWKESISNPSVLLIGCAIVLLAIPTMIGFTYAAFYLWSTAVSIAAIASLSGPGPDLLGKGAASQQSPDVDREKDTRVVEPTEAGA